jgi:hypothetical protein
MKSTMNHVESEIEGLMCIKWEDLTFYNNEFYKKGELFNVKNYIREKGLFRFFDCYNADFRFLSVPECYKPTVEPLFPGVGRYVGVAVGFRVLVGIAVVPEFFTIVGIVVRVMPLSEVPPSPFAIIG